MNLRNCWYSSMRGCHIFDENWKTVSLSFENRCSKCSKGPRQIPSRGDFFQQGKLFHCVWGKASKWMLSLSVTLDYSFEMLGKKIQKEAPSMQLDPWGLRKKQISDGDHHWERCFVAGWSGDISRLHRAISKYVPSIGQRYPPLASHLIQCFLWYLTFFSDIKRRHYKCDFWLLRLLQDFARFRELISSKKGNMMVFVIYLYKFSRFKCHQKDKPISIMVLSILKMKSPQKFRINWTEIEFSRKCQQDWIGYHLKITKGFVMSQTLVDQMTQNTHKDERTITNNQTISFQKMIVCNNHFL